LKVKVVPVTLWIAMGIPFIKSINWYDDVPESDHISVAEVQVLLALMRVGTGRTTE
jgi:hypothetical protein